MGFSYSSALATDIHRVRFLIRDTVEANAGLQDEEILWILGEEPNIYFAAARAGEAAFLADGKGISSVSIGGLSISRGSSPEEAYRKYLSSLREKGAHELLPSPKAFEVL